MAKKVTDEKLIEHLLIQGGVKGAAAACGLSQNAIYKRLRNPEFRAQYDMMQGVVLSTVAGALAGVLEKAVWKLARVLDDPTASPGLIVTAANAILNQGHRYIEVASILRRLEALEQIGSEYDQKTD